MARSEYIYVVIDPFGSGSEPGDYMIKATFTVKHELVRWLRGLPRRELAWLDAYRCHDGTWRDKPPVKLSLEELLNG